MALWEYSITWQDGTVLGQTLLAEGADEAEAAASAISAASEHSCRVVPGPGHPVPADVEARWREIHGGNFPQIVSDRGRLAHYARGVRDPSISIGPDGA